MVVALIAAGGALGSVCRYLLSVLIQRQVQTGFPYGTLVVNILGCTAIGVLVRLLPPGDTVSFGRAALIIGFCGGFTTFSAFSLETVLLIQTGAWTKAAAYVIASVVACATGTAIGLALTRPPLP
jgi:CrcB protein